MKRCSIKRKPFKVKKTPTKALVKKADKLWRQAILLRDNNTCQWCGRSGDEWKLECHHIFGRRHKHLKHNINNGIALCFNCHKGNMKSAHENPEAFRRFLHNWMNKIYLYPDLYAESLITVKPDYPKAIETLESWLKEHGE